MEEVWKPIKGYEGLYEVSNYGEVINIRTKRVLKGYKTKKGYLEVTLYKNGDRKSKKIHRLVMETHCPIENMENLQVNHRDECKENNRLDNLEWCDAKYNNNCGTRIERQSKKVSKAVCHVVSGMIYSSAAEAHRQTGISASHISECCNGKRKTAGGSAWYFVEVNKT